jgi:signal transduction histidine kinase
VATLADEFGVSGASEIELDISVDPATAERLPTGHRVQLLQMAREAPSNAVRHAHAGRIVLALASDGPVLELSVEDDGVGFDAGVTPSSGHLGLANLRDRAAGLGDELVIDSQPGRGTRLRIRVPIPADDPPQEPAA